MIKQGSGIQRYNHLSKATVAPPASKGCADVMKVRIGWEQDAHLIHSVGTTAANGHDLTPATDPLDSHEEVAQKMLHVKS